VNVEGPLLQVSSLGVRFEQYGRSVQAVDGLSYQLSAGATLAIIGESGSGKTVSCRALMGLLPPTAAVSGSARLDGAELLTLTEAEMRRRRGTDVSMVFQDPARALNPTIRVGHQIAEAVRRRETLDRREAQERTIDLLRMLCVADPQRRFFAYPHELSGGLRQRVMIAIALAGNPRLLIADEATRSLDAITQAETLRLLKDLQQRIGMALIMISHDLRLALSFADDVLVMYGGRAVEFAASRRLSQLRRAPYTKALLDAIPCPDRPAHTRFPSIPGQPPDPAALPPGCLFEPRCAYARDICKTTRPPYEEHDRGHWWACWNPCEQPEPAR
jgi:oligopeptide/dipeptide ABC transporter ATP-binding protein